MTGEDKVSKTPDILKKIIARTEEDLRAIKSGRPLKELRSRLADLKPTHGFEARLRQVAAAGETAVIAEVKKGSPSKGIIRADFDPLAIAGIYEQNGAACLSILTEKHFFLGSLEYLTAIRDSVAIPLLRKDFMVDEYQLYEARTAGADAILLIAACLELSQLRDYHAIAADLGMDVLLEVHDEWEMELALQTDCTLIGVNNRNLRTFVTDLATTGRLACMLPPERLLVAESGINCRADVENLANKGASAFLIGESMMREADIGAKLKELRGC
jgi:indole-3-glycerol phosphate synthase